MNKGYEVSLRWVMKHHVTTMVASVVVLIATIHMFGLVPKGFIPSEDTGQILINTEGAQGVSYEQMVQYQQQLAAHRRQGSKRGVIFLCHWIGRYLVGG